MRLLTFSTPQDPRPRAGLREGDEVFDLGKPMREALADLPRLKKGKKISTKGVLYHPAVPDA